MRKKIILIIALLVIISTITGIVIVNSHKDKVKETETKEQTSKEPIKNEKNEEDNDIQIETENPPPKETPNVDSSNNEEEIENPSSDKDDKPQKENNNSNSPTTNNQSSNNQSSNKQQSSSNNNQEQQNNNTTTTPENNETSNEPTIVTSNNINLSDYNTNIKITKPGTYTLSGKLNNTLYIDSPADVTLNLNGITIKSKSDSAIANVGNNDLKLNLMPGTISMISDAKGIESEYDGSLFSNGSIIIDGTGTLNVYGNQIDGEGIATKNSPITINNGNVNVYSVDDGLNTGGSGGTIMINDGNVYIEAGGDGIDSNLDIVFNGGITFVTGGSELINGGLDADQGIKINGGKLIALGSDQLQTPTQATQTVLCMNITKSISKGSLITLLDENDNTIISFEANDNFKNVIISMNNITAKEFYIYLGGTHTGTKINGVYSDGNYTKGTAIDIKGRTAFEIYDTITTY